MQAQQLPFNILLYGTVFSALAVSVLLFHFYRREARLSYLIWTLAFLAAGARYALTIYVLPLSLVLHYLNALRGLLLLWGAAVFLGKRPGPRWLTLLLIPALWLGLAGTFEWSFFWVALVPSVLGGLGYLALGTCFWVHRPAERWNGYRALAVIACLEGVHILDYPVFGDGPQAPWGYALGQVLHYLLAAALLWIRVRSEQDRAQSAVQTREQAMQRVLRNRRRLTEMRESFELLMEKMSDGIITCDTRGQVTGFNRGAERLFGYRAGEVLQRPLTHLLPEIDATRLHEQPTTPREMNARHSVEENFVVEVSLSELALSRVQARVVIVRDISERKSQQERLSHLADHDSLTGLLNRRALEQRLAAHLPEVTQGLLVFLDLDDFKMINDSMGHDAGDAALQALAQRLVARAGEQALVSRHSGDEFVIFRPGDPDLDVDAWLETLVAALRQPMVCQELEVMLSGSVGVARYPDQGQDVGELIRNADMAMYQAKRTGKNHYAWYDATLLGDINRTADIATRLKKLDPDRELRAVFQPRMEFNGRRLMGAEVLLRWCTPEGEWIPPDQFIPVAEETGQILRLGYWVMEYSCRRLVQWLDQAEPLVLSVNLSARQLFDERLIERLEAIRQRYYLAPAQLEFEITESSAMQDLEYAVRVLSRLRALGYGLSLDDFGTGFSSLSHLRRLPVDTVKIDRSFVHDMVANRQARVMVASIIELVSNLGMSVLAEGVETAEQAELLDSMGCDQVQGYYLAQPLEAEPFAERVLNNWSQLRSVL